MDLEPKYLDWLHDLSTLGYEENIIINTSHRDAIEYFFKSGLTPPEALERYKNFVRRWKAIQADYAHE